MLQLVRFGVPNREERPGCLREIAPTTPQKLHAANRPKGQTLRLQMKKIFSHENMITFGFVILAMTVTVIVVIPLVRKFVPAGILPALPATTTVTTPAATS
jgi:hypothetical protein